MPYMFIDPDQDDHWAAFAAYRQRREQFAAEASFGMGQNVAALAAHYPTMQPGVLLALGRAGVQPGTPMAEQLNQAAPAVARQKAADKPWWRDMFNATVRGAGTALQFIPETIWGTARQAHRNVEDYGIAGLISGPFQGGGLSQVMDQTTIGQINEASLRGLPAGQTMGQTYGAIGQFNPANIAERQRQAGIQTGSGFFVNPESEVGQAQAEAARRAWMVDGHAATLGRVIAGNIAEADTTGYNMLSGAFDFGAALFDPTNVYGGQVAKARQAGRLFQASDEGALTGKTGQYLTAGLMKAERPVVSSDIARDWLQSRAGRAVTERLTEMDSPTDIRNALKKRIDMDTAVQLADAKTPEAVQSIFMEGAVSGRMREKPYTNGISSWKPVMGAGIELRRRLENIRLATNLPGDKFMLNDLTQATETLDNTLKNANFKVDETRLWTDRLARTTSSEQRRTVIMGALGEVAKKIGSEAKPENLKVGTRARFLDGEQMGTISHINPDGKTAVLEMVDRVGGSGTVKVSADLENLISEADIAAGQAAEGMVRVYKRTTERFTSYNIDDAGKEVGIEGLTIDRNGHAVPQPILLSQLMHETLPGFGRNDLIAIRRATSNPLIAKVLTNDKYDGAAAAARLVNQTWRNLTLIRGAYTLRVVGEEQLRLAANGLNSMLSFHPIHALAYIVGDRNPRVPFTRGAKEIDVQSLLRKRGSGPRGATDIWGRRFDDSEPGMEGFTQFQQAHMQSHGDKRWAVNTTFDGWVPVAKGDERYVTGLSQTLAQLHNDPLAARLAGGWRGKETIQRTGNDIEDAKEWFFNGDGAKYRQMHAERGGKWAALADDREVSDRYVDALADMVRRNTNEDPELMELVAYGIVNKKTATRRAAEELVARKAEFGNGPDMVRANLRDITPEKRSRWNDGIDTAFDVLITRPSNLLSRSPAFRQYYWQRVGEMMSDLTEEAQQEVLVAAREANLEGRLMGVLERQVGKNKGDIDMDAADLLAKNFALDSTKSLLYDLGDRSQFFDMTKILFPFGEAWKEVIQTWTRTLSQNPHQLYRLKQGVEGSQEAGFVYTDENGEQVFNYPLSGHINQFFTGVYTPFKGRLSGLNVAGEALPGLGPMVQITMDQIVKHKPNTPDWVHKLVMPYGGPDYSNGLIEAFFPGYSKKLLTAAAPGDEGDANTAFGTAWGRTMQLKLAGGKYDISTEPGMQELIDDSKSSARLLFVLRGLAQAVLPTAPAPEWTVKDEQGQLTTVAKILQDYNELRSDPAVGYENADEVFLARYGENALLFMQPLSQGGFTPLRELHEWVKEHPDQAAQYRDVYGYFAGDGGEFANLEYDRQVAMGERVRLRPREVLELANHRVAALQYRQARDLVGERPTRQGREFLRNIQAELMGRYPGYSPLGGTGKRKDRTYLISEVMRAVNDPVIGETEAGRAAAEYISLRNQVKERMPGFATSNSGRSARSALRQYGTYLAVQYPEFRRMWIDLLERELTDDTEVV